MANQNFSSRPPENPNTLASKDVDIFRDLDAKSLAGNFAKGVKKIGRGLQEGADTIGEAMLDKNASKKAKRLTGYGVEAGGFAGLAWLARKIFTKANTNAKEKEGMGLGTKLLVGGTLIGLGVLGLSKIDFSKLNILGGLGDQLEKMKTTLADLEKQKAEIEKGITDAIKNGKTELTKTLNEELKKVQNQIDTATQEATAMMETGQKEAKEKLETLKNELQKAKAMVPQNPIMIAKLESEILALQAAEKIISPTNQPEKPAENKEISTEEKIFNETWQKTLSILVKNGIITAAASQSITSSEAFKIYLQKESTENPVVQALLQATGKTTSAEANEKAYYALAIGTIALFLIKEKFKSAAGIGGILMMGAVLKQDTDKTENDIENIKNTTQELYELYSDTLEKQGYSDNERMLFLSTILGNDIMSFINLDHSITPETAKANQEGWKTIRESVQKNKLAKANGLEKVQQDALKDLDTIIAINNEIIAKNEKRKISQDTIERLFFKLGILGISPRSNGIEKINNLYSLSFEMSEERVLGFKLVGFPFNPLPDRLANAERKEQYSSKEYMLLSEFGRQLALLESDTKKNTSKLQNEYTIAEITELKNKINTITEKEVSGVPFPEKTIEGLIPEIKKLANGIYGTVFEIDGKTNTFHITFAHNNVRTLIGLGENFNRNALEPRKIQAYGENDIWKIIGGEHQKHAESAIENRRANMIQLYKSLPNNSPLKQHFEKHLINKTEGVLDDMLFADAAWWAEFWWIIFTNPTDSAFAKIKAGMITVAIPAGEVVISSLLDPLDASIEGFQSLFGYDDLTMKEWLMRSFLGAGVLFASIGAIQGIVSGGIVGGAKGLTAGAIRGLKIYNPVIDLTYRGMLLGIRKSHNKSNLLALTKERLSDPNSFVPKWVHRFRDGSEEYLFKAYARNLKEMDMYHDANGKASFLASGEIFRIEQENKVLENIIKSKFSMQDKQWREFVDNAKDFSTSNLSYSEFTEQKIPSSYFKAKIEDTILKIKTIANATDTDIANIAKSFDDIAIEIESRRTETTTTTGGRTIIHNAVDAEKIFELKHTAMQAQFSALIKNANTSNLPAVSQKLITNKANIESILNDLNSFTSNDTNEAKRIEALKKVLTEDLDFISQAINDATSGKIPRLSNKYLNFSINPFKKFGWNFDGWQGHNALETAGNIAKKAGIVGEVAMIVPSAVEAVGNISVDAMDKKGLREEVQDVYGAKGAVQATKVGIETVSLWGGPVVAAVVIAIAESTLGNAENALDAKLIGTINEHEAGVIWTKENILQKISYNADTDLNTDIKEMFYSIYDTIPFIDNAKRDHSVEQIRNILWKAIAILESGETAFESHLSKIQFQKAYEAFITLNTKNSSTSHFETLEIHESAKKYATEEAQKIETAVKNAERGIGQTISEKDLSNLLTPPSAFVRTVQKPAETKEKIPENKLFVHALFGIAKKFQYTGKEDENELKLFFSADKQAEQGIYWYDGGMMFEKGWYIYRREMILPDVLIEGKTDTEKLSYMMKILSNNNTSVFVSDNYGTIESGIDAIYEAFGVYNKNREVMKQNTNEVVHSISNALLQNIPEAELSNIKSAKTQEEKAVLIMLLQKQKLTNSIMSEIKNGTKKTIIFSPLASYDIAKKEFYYSLREDLPPVSYSTQEIQEKKSLQGDALLFQQCMEVAKNL